jgi:hypothetical protein
MVDEALVRKRFEILKRSEILEELAKPDDYTPESYSILKEVANSQGITEDTLEGTDPPQSSWRLKLKPDDIIEWNRRFDLAGILDENTISHRDISQSLTRLISGMLIGNLAFLLGIYFSYWFLLGGLLAFVFFAGGVLFAKRILFHHQDPLELRRWKRCWQGDAVGYSVSIMLLAPLMIGEYKTFASFVEGTLPYLLIACVAGIITGLAWAQVFDKKEKTLVLEAFRAWQIDKDEHPPSQDN